MIGEHHPTLGIAVLLHQTRHARSVEDIVAQHQSHLVVADKLLAQHKSLRQTVGNFLHLIRKTASYAASVAQKPLEIGQILRGGNDEYIANPCHHEHRQRVVNHGLVVDRHHLFAHGQRERVKTCTGTAG